MSDNDNKGTSGGIGFFGLLAIVFITLKLTGFIAWKWWVVLLPLWAPFAIAAVVLLVVVIVKAIVE